MRQDALRRDTDGVDTIIEQWRRERPDVDVSAKEVTGRIVRLAGFFQEAYAEAFEALGITGSDFGMLAPLRRAGPPFELTPTDLARQRMMTSGGITAAIDRLERKGLLTRLPNPSDRRGSLVRLTEEGREVIDAAIATQAGVEHRLIGALDAGERERLRSLLRTLLIHLETR